MIALDQIWADPEFNCRGVIYPESVASLAASMEAIGLLQPILVTPHTLPPWKIVAGHRRYAAAQILGWNEIDCIRLNCLTEHECRKANLQENMARKDLTPTQEMRALVTIYGEAPDVAQVAAELGMSRKWVLERLRLREMEQRVLDKVDEGMLGALDLQYLLTVQPEERWNLASRLMEGKAAGRSSKSVAREARLRQKVRGMKQIRLAIEVVQDLGKIPHWIEALGWAAGDVPSEKFFGQPLDKLKKYGILE